MSIALWQEVKALKRKVEELEKNKSNDLTERLEKLEGKYMALNARVGKALKKDQE